MELESALDDHGRPYVKISLDRISPNAATNTTYAVYVLSWLENELEAHDDQIENMIEEARAEHGEYSTPDLYDCRLTIWQERGSLSITLEDTRNDDKIVTWWDSAAPEAIEDGTLKHSAVLGRFSERDNRLKKSAYEYARDTGMLDRSWQGDRDIKPDPNDCPGCYAAPASEEDPDRYCAQCRMIASVDGAEG